MFAKIYNSDSLGQILVKVDRSTCNRPEVRIYFEHGVVGVLSSASSFRNTVTGWTQAQSMFDNLTQEAAVGIIIKTLNRINHGEPDTIGPQKEEPGDDNERLFDPIDWKDGQ